MICRLWAAGRLRTTPTSPVFARSSIGGRRQRALASRTVLGSVRLDALAGIRTKSRQR